MFQLGIHAIISLIIYMLCIGFSFQAVKAFRFEQLLKKGRVFESQILLIFLAIGLGYLVASFVIAFIDTSIQLSNLF